MRLVHGALAFALLVGAGCGEDDDPAAGDTGASQPTESVAATAVPTVEASDAEAVVFTVTQADDGCTISGPDTVPADETYFVVVENPTEEFLDLYVSLLADGHTYQEFVELQEAPGKLFPRPSYIEYATYERAATTEFNETADLSDDESGYAFSSEPGPHAVYTWISRTEGFWLCGTFEAVAP